MAAKKGFTCISVSAVLSIVALVLGGNGCGSRGGTGTARHTATLAGTLPAKASQDPTPSGKAVKSDGDADNPRDLDGNPDPDGPADHDDDSRTPESYRYPDDDDKVTLAYGHSPPPGERGTIAEVVRRYYTAARAADGAVACTSIDPSLAKAIPEDYGSGAGPAYLRGGKTCGAVMSLIFTHGHAELAVAPKALSVRVTGNAAQVVVGSRTLPASLLHLKRQGRTWYIQNVLGSPLP